MGWQIISCFVGSFLVQVAVQVHGNHHGCNLGWQEESQHP